MDDIKTDQPGLTVGDLRNLPLGTTRETVGQWSSGQSVAGTQAIPASENEGPNWIVSGGEARRTQQHRGYRSDGVEALEFNNPFNLTMERVWYDGKIVYAVDCGRIEVDPAKVKVAQEYQIVYTAALDEQGKLLAEPETVPGQYNVYDSVPGQEKYSPIWQFNYVVVPRDYEVNALRSEDDCLTSGYKILHSNVFEN
ncbi:MAG: hypothetical protein IT305_27515 [Chloroflexi bacterium]|nr:hypothetical protein [Chloroflexota bacterium]